MLLEQTAAPIYAVSAAGEILMANAALCEWVNLAVESVVGREVRYHSEPDGTAHAAPLAGLCPPPSAFEQPEQEGTLSTIGRDGKLRHRRARFLRLPAATSEASPMVIAIAETVDLSAQQLAQRLSDEPTLDELHRDIRRLRHETQEPEAAALLLGDSPAARRLRAQYDLALQTGSALVLGDCPADAASIARAIHYARQAPNSALVPIDCKRLDTAEALRLLEISRTEDDKSFLLLEPGQARAEFQEAVANALQESMEGKTFRVLLAERTDQVCDASLLELAGPVRVDVPGLSARLDDLPVIVQYWVEHHNSNALTQISGASDAAIDQLGVYNWPGGVAQLGKVVLEACENSQSSQLTPGDLPPLVKHAVAAASIGDTRPEPIDLDQLLLDVQREVVQRALVSSKDNKAEAARLLGLTRQRLYRLLETLGLSEGNHG